MKKLLTKANGYKKTNYFFTCSIGNYSTELRKVYLKDNKYYVEYNGKIINITGKTMFCKL